MLLKKGPFTGQMLFGDVAYGGIQRADLEKVDGEYQGAVFRHTQGLEAGVTPASPPPAPGTAGPPAPSGSTSAKAATPSRTPTGPRTPATSTST